MSHNERAEAVAMLRQAMTTAGAPDDTANQVAIACVDQLIRNGWRPPEPWMFANDGTADEKFAAVEALFERARAASTATAEPASQDAGDSLSDLVAWVGDHRFDYVEHDTGTPKCRHKSHVYGYAGACTQAIVRQVFPSLFRGDKP